MKLTEIWIYPIKSCQGISLTSALVTNKGLKDAENPTFYDRNFMIVDQGGNFLTQREYPQMARIKVTINGENLILTKINSDLADFQLSPNNNKAQKKVKVWRDNTVAIDQGDEVANWLKSALELKKPCRLVKQSDEHIRAIDSRYSINKNQPVSFADGYPFLLTNTASLAQLNQYLEDKYPQQNQQVNMVRFRANLVLETNQPFAEDNWQEITVEKVKFKLVKPCTRCIITTTNQQTGERNKLKEPLATLSTFRQIPKQGVMFGQNLIALNEGIISLNSSVNIN